jgi:peroxiredoxin
MFAPFLVLLSALAADPAPLVFQGTLAPGDEKGAAAKTFDLTLWLKPAGETTQVFWLVEERGRGAWPWVFRFGQVHADKQWRAEAGGPALWYERDAGGSAVSVPLPLFAAERQIVEGSEWTDGDRRIKVERAEKRGERELWQVSIRDRVGRRRNLAVAKDSPLVVALEEHLTVGQGEPHVLKLKWISGEPATAAQPPPALEALLALREKLALGAASGRVDWKPAQLSLLKEQLPLLAKSAAGTPLERLVTSAQRDLGFQKQRASDLAGLSAKVLNRPAPAFTAENLSGESLDSKELAGKVTVLHFWEYRDEPLKEPYGQVGYLEFLYQRRQADGVRVYGVAVDGRLADEATAPAARRSARKLREFMNLSYPLLLDRGKLLESFGDPRPLGATLPLFVVIGRDGKIAHHHVGHYDVVRDRGLVELDAAVGKLLEEK